MTKSYTATARRDGGWWVLIVELDEPDRTLGTQVRRLDQAQPMVIDLLASFFDLPKEEFAIRVVPVLDDDTCTEVRTARSLKSEAERIGKEAGEATRKAAQHLQAQGLTVRDIAGLLGITHQRVSQIIRGS